MVTITDQLTHEYDSIKLGSDKYKIKQHNLISKGLRNETDAATNLISRGIEQVATALESIANNGARGVGGSYNKLLRYAATTLDDNGNPYEDYFVLSYIGLQTLFQALTPESIYVDLNSVLHKVARRIETNHKCRLFEEAHPGYYHTVVNSFDAQLVKSYEHKHKVLMTKFNQFDLKWEAWDATKRMQIGVRIIRAITETLDIFEVTMRYKRNKSIRCLTLTDQANDWIEAFNTYRGLLSPICKPCLITPRPWEKVDGGYIGGYYTPGIFDRTPFIKAWTDAHKEYVGQANPEQHLKAVTKLQNTAWSINTQVLDIQQKAFPAGIGLPDPNPNETPEFPTDLDKDKSTYTEADFNQLDKWKSEVKIISTKNKERMGKVIAYSIALRLAEEYKDREQFYFVYNCDFRGRIYCATHGLSPQGEDSAKALLKFAEGVPMGESGLFWLAVHGANVWGEDKLTYEDRVEWIQNHEEMIIRIVDDPLSNREWLEADKPWQFLAFCFEWEACGYGTLPDTIGHLPIALDGSCNGLQHYSALLRDPVGAKATNLINSEIPEDIYQEVANLCTKKLELRDDRYAAKWLQVGVSRKCTKRPVMTLPYGATQTSARQYIHEYVLDHAIQFGDSDFMWECSKYLTPILWDSINETVLAARTGMDWLQQQTSSIIRDRKEPISWLTPIGFPVYQRYFDFEEVRVQTALLGSMKLSVRNELPRVSLYKQKLGIAPNFVHSLDSTHMVMTICDTDLNSYAMIHDDFGTHAGNTEELFSSIRESFVDMYSAQNPLSDWYSQMQVEEEDRVDLPEIGCMDVTDVLESDFFFG